ncbi:MAG: DUF5685 family protein [Oscillospiraceae bacterium]
MFGYILPLKPELKIKDFNFYKSVYCGLCKRVGQKYGFNSRFLLNYDMVLLAILKDALTGETPSFSYENCIANPFAKNFIAKDTKGLDYGADCLVLFSYHKIYDDIYDEKSAKKLVAKTLSSVFKNSYRRAALAQPLLDKALCEQMQNQKDVEKSKCDILDAVCDPSAKMVAVAAQLLAQTEEEKPDLYRLGLFLGKLIYLLDAADDFEKDIKTGSFNVFALQKLDKAEMIKNAKIQCKICAAEISNAYVKLNIKQNKAILDNIIYLGLPTAIEKIGCPHTKNVDLKKDNF